MITANVHQAKTNLSKLLDEAADGKDVYITRRGRKEPTRFKLTLEALPKQKRSDAFGCMKNEIIFSKDYDTADTEILTLIEEHLEK